MEPVLINEGPGFEYRSLYRIGGAAAIIAAALTLCEVVVFAIYPQPDSVHEWFELIQANPVIGWLDLWGLELPMYAMFLPVFLALYAALRKTDPGLMLIALAASLLGIGVFFATNNPFAVLSLAHQHAAAATDAQRSVLLAAGQALLAHTGQRAVGGVNMGLFLVSVGGLTASWVMLRSAAFGRAAALAGLLANALSLADYARAALTSSKIAALIMILPNVLFLTVWLLAVGRMLKGLGLAGRPPAAPPP
jgi:hypothetical protein